MGPPKQKAKQPAMPSMLKSIQRTAAVASATVDTNFGASARDSSTMSTGVGQRSAVERQSLLSSDDQSQSPTGGGKGGKVGVGAPTAPRLARMNSRHQKMKSVMDSIATRLKVQSRGANIGFRGRDMHDASGKKYRVEVPKNILALTLVAFFVLPLVLGLYVLFRQLFRSDEVHSRYQQQHPQSSNITMTSSLGIGQGDFTAHIPNEAAELDTSMSTASIAAKDAKKGWDEATNNADMIEKEGKQSPPNSTDTSETKGVGNAEKEPLGGDKGEGGGVPTDKTHNTEDGTKVASSNRENVQESGEENEVPLDAISNTLSADKRKDGGKDQDKSNPNADDGKPAEREGGAESRDGQAKGGD